MNKIFFKQLLSNKLKIKFNKPEYSEKNKKNIKKHIEICLKKKKFNFYFYCMIFLIKKKNYKILNSFNSVTLFGTGGKREIMGIGFNKINQYSAKMTAQGFAQYLVKRFGKTANKKGIVLSYDFRSKKIRITNKITKSQKKYYISSLKLAKSVLKKYYENKIDTYIFNSVKSTPELSFSINNLKTIAGCTFTASHNNVNYGGEKLYNHYGGQIITPNDIIIINETYNSINKSVFFKDKTKQNNVINKNVYKNNFYKIKKSNILLKKNIKILYSPMHGSGVTSIFYFFFHIGFNIYTDNKSCNLSSNFENIILKTPNPEISLYVNKLKKKANLINTRIILSTDSDADRIGMVTKYRKKWFFLNGNQMCTLIISFIISNNKRFVKNSKKPYLITKTIVTTSIINKLLFIKNINQIRNIPVGFKNISYVLNILKRTGLDKNFIAGVEESHGLIFMLYGIDKNPATIIAWIYELIIIFKKKKITFFDYLNLIYSKVGLHINQLIEFNHFGRKKKLQIENLIKYIKKKKFLGIKNLDIKNESNMIKKKFSHKNKKNFKKIVIFTLKKTKTINSIKITLRDSGTEPKVKIYIEISTLPSKLFLVKKNRHIIKKILNIIENKFLGYYHMALNYTVKK